MNSINRKYLLIFFSILIIVMVTAYVLNTVIPRPYTKPKTPVTTSAYITVRDTEGKLILETGIPVVPDDEYINENNYRYRIIKVEGNEATARLIDSPVYKRQSLNSAIFGLGQKSIPAQADAGIHVVMYHTHSDESYTPTSGTPSKPANGDIYQVGDIIKNSLNAAGISVTHSYAEHGPHDINAYHRSRRTIVQLLKEQPDAAFDIHRDSAPVASYSTTINGIATSRAMIVIGRSNPNMNTNLRFAQAVKDRADVLHPGLLRGIYMGKGDYNQDLYPTALLFEVGTEDISLDEAQKAAACLTDAIISVLYSR